MQFTGPLRVRVRVCRGVKFEGNSVCEFSWGKALPLLASKDNPSLSSDLETRIETFISCMASGFATLLQGVNAQEINMNLG